MDLVVCCAGQAVTVDAAQPVVDGTESDGKATGYVLGDGTGSGAANAVDVALDTSSQGSTTPMRHTAFQLWKIMESPYSVTLEANPQSSDITAIINGLAEFNRQHTDGAMPEYLLATVRDAQGALVGGLFGATYLGWLQVQVVWLPDTLRGHKLGTQLMALAEGEALRRGCTRVFLETYSFQALPFYEKCGYAIHSRIPDFPVGGARYALIKNLSGAA